jgi:predicted ABC-type transport system involved in lysophospholipase L1 biosynthesis ATPase subunit
LLAGFFEIASELDLAVVLATHDPLLAGGCDRVLRLERGQDALAA